jgi:hypothetical protein
MDRCLGLVAGEKAWLLHTPVACDKAWRPWPLHHTVAGDGAQPTQNGKTMAIIWHKDCKMLAHG